MPSCAPKPIALKVKSQVAPEQLLITTSTVGAEPPEPEELVDPPEPPAPLLLDVAPPALLVPLLLVENSPPQCDISLEYCR